MGSASARPVWAPSSTPNGPLAVSTAAMAALTAASARLLDSGLWGLDVTWETFRASRKHLNLSPRNCGPLYILSLVEGGPRPTLSKNLSMVLVTAPGHRVLQLVDR